MPSLDERGWNQTDRDALDRYITGNWGEDQFLGQDIDPENEPYEDLEPTEPEMRLVYIRFEPGADVWHIYDCHTQDQLDYECGSFGSNHAAVDYCTDQDWDVRDGPMPSEDEEDQGFYAEEAYFDYEHPEDSPNA